MFILAAETLLRGVRGPDAIVDIADVELLQGRSREDQWIVGPDDLYELIGLLGKPLEA